MIRPKQVYRCNLGVPPSVIVPRRWPHFIETSFGVTVLSAHEAETYPRIILRRHLDDTDTEAATLYQLETANVTYAVLLLVQTLQPYLFRKHTLCVSFHLLLDDVGMVYYRLIT